MIDRSRLEFGVSLRAMRRERRMSQGQLALAAGVQLYQVSKIESGTLDARMDTVFRITAALNVTPRLIENDIEQKARAA